MSIIEQEQAFLSKIDCKFPYRDASKAAAFIAEAQSISSNAAFCVLYEIVCPPPSIGLPKQTQRELLATWIEYSTFPLAATIADLATPVIGGEGVPTERALAVMREVSSVDGQYAALAVVSHLAYQGVEEADFDLIDALEQETRNMWDKIQRPL
jgi:hypothetical protein